jgi:phage terminase large subunit GpA-like protein
MLLEINRAIRRGLKPLEIAELLRLSQWAERHFYLSAESSYVEQKWTAYPYQVAIMDCMSNDDIQEVDVRKSARVGYTKMMLAGIGYFTQHKRRNQGVWQPTDEDSDEFVKTDLEPMLRDVPVMQEVFPSFLQRHRNNTLRQKVFLGTILHLRGGKAAKNYRRLTIDIGWGDEIDGFDHDVEKEGNPPALIRKRVEGATFPKVIFGSTPKLKGLSLIEAREKDAAQRFSFKIPCPHCDHVQPLRWGGKDKPYGLKWQPAKPETVAHLCEACGTLFSQPEYSSVWHEGRWIAEDGTSIDGEGRFRAASGEVVPAPRSVAFNVWTAYSPQTTWEQIVREFLSALKKAEAGDTAELKTFVNLTLGESWEEEVEKTEGHELAARAESYRLRIVPLGGLVLVAGVDVQDNRFEVVVWALGRGEEMWPIDYVVLEANPADERDWLKLDAYLQTTFEHQAGGKLRIEAIGVDTGGHFTHQAYNFCRQRVRRRIYAVKGETKYGQPVKARSTLQDVNWKGAIIKSGVKLWHVGTDTAKDLFFGRLKVTQPGPGYVHFSRELPEVFYDQITAEARVLQKTAQGEQHRWVALRTRNEVLDCTVYAIFAAHMLDLHRYTERMWQKLEESVQPAVGDLFLPKYTPESSTRSAGENASPADAADGELPPDDDVQTSAQEPARQRRVAPARRNNFVNRWQQ